MSGFIGGTNEDGSRPEDGSNRDNYNRELSEGGMNYLMGVGAYTLHEKL